jgi:hypothetical protein
LTPSKLPLVLLFFVIAIPAVPHLDAQKEELEASAKARDAMTKTISAWFPTARIELKQLGGFNLKVWISKHDFETVSYLDRKGLLETVGRSWCESFGGWKCPVIAVRDDKNGKEIASYHCLFSYAKIEEQ